MTIPSRITAVLLLYLLSATAIAGTIPDMKSVVYSKTDSILAEQIISELSPNSEENFGALVAQTGLKLLGTPYVGQTLENGRQEPLIINLRELDCTTFAENCLALGLAARSPKPGFGKFVKELEKIRYRQGKRNGYLSRLHYFSDWIYDNGQKGLISEPASDFGSPFRVQVNFMSSHPDSYPVLKDHPELIPDLISQEKAISDAEQFFLKKEDIRSNEDQLREGDIVGLTTAIAGLDVAHVGILVKKNGRIHLLHASSTLKQVVVSEEPLSEMLMNKKSYTGILIARPK